MEEITSTSAAVEVAKRKEFNVTRQMLGRPGRVSHRNDQCSSVNSFGMKEPAGAFEIVSTNRNTYISTSGALTMVSAKTMGQVLKCPIMAASQLDSRLRDKRVVVEQAQVDQRQHDADYHQDQSHGGTHAVLEIAGIVVERGVVDPQRPDLRRASRAAVRRQERLIDGGQQRKGLITGHEQDRTFELRQNDVADLLPAIGTIHARRVEQRFRDRLDGRGENDHAHRGANETVDDD